MVSPSVQTTAQKRGMFNGGITHMMPQQLLQLVYGSTTSFAYLSFSCTHDSYVHPQRSLVSLSVFCYGVTHTV